RSYGDWSSDVCSSDLRYEALEGADALFTATFVDYLLALHDRLAAPIRTVLSHRAEALRRAVTQGALPTHPPRGPATTGDWKVPQIGRRACREGGESWG